MNMDAAGVVDLCTACAELAHKFLHRFNIFVLTDRRNKFHRIVPACRTVVTVAAADGGVTYHFPLTVAVIPDGIGVIPAADMGRLRIEMSRNNPCRRCSCQPGHLNFDTEVLASQTESPSVRPGAPTAEEGTAFGFFGLTATVLFPVFSSINSRTPAGTCLLYNASAAFSISSSKDRSFCAIYSLAAESFSASKGTLTVIFFMLIHSCFLKVQCLYFYLRCFFEKPKNNSGTYADAFGQDFRYRFLQ